MPSPFAMIDMTGQQSAVPVASLSGCVASGDDHPVHSENIDLRKRAIYEACALPLAYDHSTDHRKQTTALPIGTQTRFISAAKAAAQMGCPLNALLTIRWNSLHSDYDGRWLSPLPIPKRIDRLVERLRKWLGVAAVAVPYIWVREAKGTDVEHWHFAFHLPVKRKRALADYIAKITEEPAAVGRRLSNRTEGEFAIGEESNWHLAEDTHPERKGFYLAAYLGKGEPSQRMFRGKLIDNEKKPVRGQRFGGDQPCGKYDSDQGVVIGTAHRGKRFDLSKLLKGKVAISRKRRVVES